MIPFFKKKLHALLSLTAASLFDANNATNISTVGSGVEEELLTGSFCFIVVKEIDSITCRSSKSTAFLEGKLNVGRSCDIKVLLLIVLTVNIG
ncbi:hypothetical protein TNIN_314491 [Trichonephila inaurata madagascariensis]|uniref:Secreted protein n=1 Tax=Trichonephila inaurata madagascariensis TaxID=2747483 RepID=A0A8X6Y1J7_9ARAC|nr:hypothetical protein TNIN_314491 [Trichonephila inaurata madagascariensis]